MQVNVRLYSVARHRDGQIIDRVALQLPVGSSAGAVLDTLKIDPLLEPVLSVNGVVAEAATPLSDGDEVAIIPAVAGG